MVVSVNTIPSVNYPLTDKQGRITPVWREFLRQFVSDTADGSINESVNTTSVTAGAGLTGGGTGDITLVVGAGSGITVNADDVNVDISGQTRVQAELDDEILISDRSDNNAIRKTKLRDVASLSSPGGIDSYVQYNSNGIFQGHSGLTYDGNGSLGVNSTLTINGVNFTSANNAATSPFVFTVPAGSAAAHFTFTQSGTGSSMPVDLKCTSATVQLNLENDSGSSGSTTSGSEIRFIKSGSVKWTIGLTGSSSGSTFTLGTTGTNVGNAFTVDATNRNFAVNNSLLLSTTAGITASTTQAQGQGAITTDIAVIATCANVNDTVTLPAALAGRQCLVVNNGAQTLQVFPASGDDLGAGVNTSTTIVAGSRKWFVSFNTTDWEPVI